MKVFFGYACQLLFLLLFLSEVGYKTSLNSQYCPSLPYVGTRSPDCVAVLLCAPFCRAWNRQPSPEELGSFLWEIIAQLEAQLSLGLR